MRIFIALIAAILFSIGITYGDCSDTSQGDCSGTSQSTVKKSNAKKELVVNGNFKERYKGWERAIGDVSKGSSKTEIVPFPNGLPGQLLHIRHQGEGNIQFSQTVDVPSPDLIFSVSFQAKPHEGAIHGFSGSGVTQIALTYLNENGDSLGQTILLNYVKNPFADTPLIGVPRRTADTNIARYIELENNKFYTGYKIDIRKEIEDNLLGVILDNIKKIAVVIWCGASHPQAGAELWVTDISLKPKGKGNTVQGNKPPMPYEDAGACPFECCTYREWVANDEVPILSDRNEKASVAFRVRKGEKVIGETGVVITLELGQGKVRKDIQPDKSGVTIPQGSVVYILSYAGEGFWKIWHQGKIYVIQEGTDFVMTKNPKTIWWVKIRNGKGQSGWSNHPEAFGNKDACG